MNYDVNKLQSLEECDAALQLAASLKKLVIHNKSNEVWDQDKDVEAVEGIENKIVKTNGFLMAAQAGLVTMAEGTAKEDAKNNIKSLEVSLYNLNKSKLQHGAVAYLGSQLTTARFDHDLDEIEDFVAAVEGRKVAISS